MPKTIAIDLDDTLAATASKVCLYIEEKINIKFTKKDIVNWSISSVIPQVEGHEREMYAEVWKNPAEIELEDPDIPNILDNLREKFRVWIVTASSGEDKAIREWLEKKGVAYEGFFHLEHSVDKHGVPGVDIYIDDHVLVAENAARDGKTAILLRQPWNEDFIKSNGNQNIIPADNWRHVEEILLTRFVEK